MQDLYCQNPVVYADAVELYSFLIIVDRLIPIEQEASYDSAVSVLAVCLSNSDLVTMLGGFYCKHLSQLKNQYEILMQLIKNSDVVSVQSHSTGTIKESDHITSLLSQIEPTSDTSSTSPNVINGNRQALATHRRNDTTRDCNNLNKRIHSTDDLYVAAKKPRFENDLSTQNITPVVIPCASVADGDHMVWSNYGSLRVMCSENFLQNISLVSILRRGYYIDVVGKTLQYPLSLLIGADCSRPM